MLSSHHDGCQPHRQGGYYVLGCQAQQLVEDAICRRARSAPGLLGCTRAALDCSLQHRCCRATVWHSHRQDRRAATVNGAHSWNEQEKRRHAKPEYAKKPPRGGWLAVRACWRGGAFRVGPPEAFDVSRAGPRSRKGSAAIRAYTRLRSGNTRGRPRIHLHAKWSFSPPPTSMAMKLPTIGKHI